jgi:hypothetical protein
MLEKFFPHPLFDLYEVSNPGQASELKIEQALDQTHTYYPEPGGEPRTA